MVYALTLDHRVSTSQSCRTFVIWNCPIHWGYFHCLHNYSRMTKKCTRCQRRHLRILWRASLKRRGFLFFGQYHCESAVSIGGRCFCGSSWLLFVMNGDWNCDCLVVIVRKKCPSFFYATTFTRCVAVFELSPEARFILYCSDNTRAYRAESCAVFSWRMPWSSRWCQWEKNIFGRQRDDGMLLVEKLGVRMTTQYKRM